MNDPPANLDHCLDRTRSYLLLLARMQLDARARTKIDPSGIVQQTLLAAHAKQGQFSGDEAGLLAWLRKALANNLRDARRALRREKRDPAREQSLEASLDASSSRLASWLAANQSSPSRQAMRHEDVLRLTDALALLPDAQREAIVLHHLQDWSLAETARRLDRSDAAVAGLVHRGLKRLRELMQDTE
jgi:RNA polymerase sigma-70 factor (ECF subfamily)